MSNEILSEMLSEKNRILFLIDGYKFRFHKNLKNNVDRYCCTKKACAAYIHLNNNEIIKKVLNHGNHEKDSDETLNRQTVSNQVKRKAIDDINEKPSKIIHSHLTQDVETLTTYDLTLIRKNIHHARSSIMPKLPMDLNELNISSDNISHLLITNRNENFLLVNDNISNILLFSTETNLKFLSKIDTVFVDGTFKSCPKLLTQMFTVHGLQNGNYVPLLFFILSKKETKTYEKVFMHIISECNKLNLTFSPKIVFADFEKAIHLTFLKVWPSISLKGCRFHLAQSWWRKIQTIGLSSEYKKNTEIGKYLKYFFGLPFLNSNDVSDCFTDYLMAIQPRNEKVEIFVDYILETYISNESNFPPFLWAEYSASTMRTTNSCEDFHSKLNALFYSAHPNIFIFIDVLKNIQKHTYIKLRSTHLNTRRTNIIEKETFIRNAMKRLEENQIEKLEFIQILSYKFLPYLSKKNRRYWVHPFTDSRLLRGHFSTSFEDLRNNPDKFYNYFRMSVKYLGSGCDQKDLHLTYRLGHSTIGYIIRRVCTATWETLKEEVSPN
ncbi:hypothetical protein AGLY_016902 [Aphis glycines]|uniref:MULE transposase domain-containing protein n=1 Tax=Aphis glycines TaxID=307491 RepID=A0A6G0SWB1_APHGL|nr:hypothetical protein AGLY_016902 [Aphis glycines]